MLHADVTHLVIAAFHQVYVETGLGFLESVYERSMAFALQDLGAEVRLQQPISARFRASVLARGETTERERHAGYGH